VGQTEDGQSILDRYIQAKRKKKEGNKARRKKVWKEGSKEEINE
jgi:hypothetical protein